MKKSLLALFAASALLFPFQAFAGDTYETIDPNTLEVDPYFTLDNIHDGNPGTETGIGIVYGVADHFNLGAGIIFSTDEGLADGDFAANINMIWNPVDTDHLDFDFMVDFDYSIADGFSLTPSFEVNYDLLPDQELWGLYFRLGVPVYGGHGEKHVVIVGNDIVRQGDVVADADISLTLGTYLTIAEDHQILIEGGFDAVNLAENLGETEITNAFVSLGYNVVLSDSFELTTELLFNIPKDDDEDFSAAFTLGGCFSLLGE